MLELRVEAEIKEIRELMKTQPCFMCGEKFKERERGWYDLQKGGAILLHHGGCLRQFYINMVKPITDARSLLLEIGADLSDLDSKELS